MRCFLCLFVACATGATFDVVSYGAIGDGVTDDSQAVVKALAAASDSPPSTIMFPADKTFLTGPFNMSSFMTLQVDGTIRFKSGNNTADGEVFIRDGGWPQIAPLASYGDSRDGPYLQYQANIYARDARDLVIKGTGTIDGQGDWWWFNKRNRSVVRSGRPNLIQFLNCTGIEVTGVTLRDSPFWCLHPVQSTDIYVHHMTIRSRMYAPNSDGIDPDSCRNVMIEYNDVSCGDDHIAIKAGVCGESSPNDCNDPKFTSGEYRTENVTVRYNTFRVGMGISIGSEMSGSIRNVEIYDNEIGVCQAGSCENDCCGWGPGLHFKTTLTRGGVMENIAFRNNTIYNNSGFISMETNYQTGDTPPKGYPATRIRNISFVGNRALGAGHGASFTCSVHDYCEELTVVDNYVAAGGHPWGCHYVNTYTAHGNSPAGLADCMKNSMNGTAALPQDVAEQKQQAIDSWMKSRTPGPLITLV